MGKLYILILILVVVCTSLSFEYVNIKKRIANCQHIIYQDSNEIYGINLQIIDAQHNYFDKNLNNITFAKQPDDLIGQNECFKENEYVEQDAKNGSIDSMNIPILNQAEYYKNSTN